VAGDSAGNIFLTEVFSAIQGEGALVGHRQVFVRLAGCNIRCAYCDQPEALEKVPGPCRLEQTPGRRDWRVVDSPVPFPEAVEAVDRLWTSLPHHSVSLTGGEPLFQGERLAVLAAELAQRGHRLFLETNGMLVTALRRISPHLAHVSMDVKLDSVDGEGISLERQRRFLEAAASSVPHVYCKIVVGPRTEAPELVSALEMIAATAPAVEVFLQPVTPFDRVTAAPSPDQVLALQDAALRVHPLVRVVPQTHKAIGQL
jgi:organic radical activating enzyme